MMSEWISRGLADGNQYMLVVTDTFSYEDYPVYAKDDAELAVKREAYDGKNMQRIHHTVDLLAFG